MITREQVADLREGDVVELTADRWDGGKVIGPLRDMEDGLLACGPILVRFDGGEPARGADALTVVSRAPRPLYVNSDRTEPVPGDVVRDADSSNDRHVWVKNVDGFSNEWLAVPGHVYVPRSQLPERLRLLVDGETGQVVAS